MSSVLNFLNDNQVNYVPSTDSDVLISCFNKLDHKNGDLNPSLSVNADKGYFKCWSCKISGNFAQLMAGLGHYKDINSYIKHYDKSKLQYDINTLKTQSSDVIDIPGVGKFYKDKTDTRDNSDSIIKSRKINVTPEISDLSMRVLSEDGTPEERRKLIMLLEENRMQKFEIPEKFYRIKYLEYLCERGLPSTFCENNEVYLNRENNKYFALPIKNFNGDTVNLLNISFSRETTPRMFSEIKHMSNPILGFNDIEYNRDIYIVEGWLDYLKLKSMGYNCFPTLGNKFNYFHNSIVQRCTANKFFIFDNDVPGVSMLEDTLTFISRSDTDWFGVFLNPNEFKDVGDIELLRIPVEIKQAVIEPLLTFKKYKILLGVEKYNASKKTIHSDGYSLRSDPFFADVRSCSGERNKGNSEPGSGTGTKLPVKLKREVQLSYPW